MSDIITVPASRDFQAEVEDLYVLLAAAAIQQGGSLLISDRSLFMARSYRMSMRRDLVRREVVVEVISPRKGEDVQADCTEERRGQVVLDSDRTERPDTGDQSGVQDQSLLPAYGTEGGSEAED